MKSSSAPMHALRCTPFRGSHIVRACSGKQGFTLIELLVVVGIIAILMALIIPALDSTSSGHAMTTAAGKLAGQIDLARQLAMSENQRMELRIFNAPKNPGGNDHAYRLLQIYRKDDNSPYTKAVNLPDTVEISESSVFSTLLDESNPLGGTQAKVGAHTDLEYKGLLFRPDGSTHLSPDGPSASDPLWTLTIFLTNKKGDLDAVTGLPANYATVTCDPVTGRPSVYRP